MIRESLLLMKCLAGSKKRIEEIFIYWVRFSEPNIPLMNLFSKDYTIQKIPYITYSIIIGIVAGANIFFFPSAIHTFFISFIAYFIFIALSAGRLRQLNDDPKYGTFFLLILFIIFILMFAAYKLYLNDFKLFLIIGSIPVVFINVVFWHCALSRPVNADSH